MTAHDHTHATAPDAPATGDDARRAPGDLGLLQDLLNTLDIEHGGDELAEPAALAGWLQERGLLRDDARLTAADVRRLQAVREGLRAVALTHTGGEADPDRVAALEHEAERAPLAVRFAAEPELVPAREGIAGAIGRVLAIVARAESDGTWARFKACAADTCQWAFYDHSRNRSRSWCSMEVCGNRAKARTYRERRAR
jgi:predicted RNA-binding Zn ribbon-like protein